MTGATRLRRRASSHRTRPDSPARRPATATSSGRYRDAGTIFSSAAAYYRYRPTLPRQLTDFIADRARRVNGPVLDLGCGPGPVTVALAEHGLSVIGADPSAEMLAIARERASDTGVDQIRWVRADAEQIAEQLPGVGVGAAVISDAFHYLDRPAVLAQLDRMIVPGGFVAIECSRAADGARPWWYPIVEGLVDTYAGVQRLAGQGQAYPQPNVGHENVLRASAFRRVEVLTVDYTIDISIDRLALAQLSYAYSSPVVLGDRQTAFVDDLRAELQKAVQHEGGPAGHCVADTQACVILGRRDG